ncbi:amidase [Nocardia sp. NPDC050710]|uniref:amidase n=1 Tax=Nocardia sp. NPDC050710 TaxID=3157220 RepID=UPI0033DF4A9F
MLDRVHAFCDDVLAAHDAVELAELVRRGEVSPPELAAAATARADQVDGQLHAIAFRCERARFAEDRAGDWYGVPTFLKDNADAAGMPTRHGSAAVPSRRRAGDDAFTRQFLSTGVTVLGKTAMPEFGLNPTTEFESGEPTRNPWNTAHSVGGSSGGAAALVAAGVVPVAHGNDGGGSLRIPAACTGLIGLKPTRYRHRDNTQGRRLPIRLISEGILSRTVRDTAVYVAAAERIWCNRDLPPIGMVRGPSDRLLRVGILTAVGSGDGPDAETLATVDTAAELLEGAGHRVEQLGLPFERRLVEDFLLYWALLAQLAAITGKAIYGLAFDSGQLDPFTRGLGRYYRERWQRTGSAMYQLARARRTYDEVMTQYDVVLSPVLTHAAPPLGYLSPNVPFGELLARLTRYVGYTPINNITGTPAISIPIGLAECGVPLSVMVSGAYGDERTLLELAYLFESVRPFPRIVGTAAG